MLFQKIKTRTYIIALIILQLLLTPLYAFRSQFIVPDNAQEDYFLSNYKNSPDMIGAFLASGIETVVFTLYQNKINQWKNDIQRSLPRNVSQREIARQIGYYLHDHVYKRYKLEATTLKEVFEQGLFNCLSGTVLMNILLRMFDIETHSIVLPTHVYTLATLDGQAVEIENTIREGLSISQDKEIQKRFNELTGFSYTDNRNKKVVIDWYETLGLLYSNRSFFDAQKKNHEKAFQNMMKAQVFLSESPSESRNLIAGYLNYSYYMYNNAKAPLPSYLKTLSILEEGIRRFPTYKNLQGNYLKGLDLVIENMFANQAGYEDISDLVQSSKQYLGSDDFTKLQKNLYIRSSLYHLRTNQNLDKAKESITSLWEIAKNDANIKDLIKEYSYDRVQNEIHNNSDLYANPKLLTDLSSFPSNLTRESLGCYYSQLAKNNFDAQKFENSINIIKEGIQIIGKTPLITQNGFVYAVNSAQHYINNKQYLEAVNFYKEALNFKKDRNVINNLGVLYEQLIDEQLALGNNQLVSQLIRESMYTVPNHPRLRKIHSQYQ